VSIKRRVSGGVVVAGLQICPSGAKPSGGMPPDVEELMQEPKAHCHRGLLLPDIALQAISERIHR
jgi:hypothetical protein